MRGRWSQGRPVRSTHWIRSLDRCTHPPLLLRISSGDRTPAQPGGSPGVSPRHECARRSRLSNGHSVSECQCGGLPGILSTDQQSLSVGLVGKRHGDEMIGIGQVLPRPWFAHTMPHGRTAGYYRTRIQLPNNAIHAQTTYLTKVARTELPPDRQADPLR